MSAARNVRKNLNLFVDGRGQAGQVSEYNAPKLVLKTEEYRAGGMHGPLKLTMGHEALDTDFTLFGYDADILALMGVAEGSEVQFTARQAMESWDGSVSALVHNMRGKITEIDPGTSKPGEMPSLKITMSLSYYKETVGARVVHEVDVENMVFVQNGIDVLAPVRNALGIN